MKASPQPPVPVPTPLTVPFWDAARRHELAIQRCKSCGTFQHPPVVLCSGCLGEEFSFERVSGRGRIHSRSIMHDGRVRGFENCVPFAVIAVELEEQAGLLLVANLLDAAPEDAVIGLPVQADFVAIGEEFVLPQFRRAAAA